MIKATCVVSSAAIVGYLTATEPVACFVGFVAGLVHSYFRPFPWGAPWR